jgi:hypothetical protein
VIRWPLEAASVRVGAIRLQSGAALVRVLAIRLHSRWCGDLQFR